MTASDGAPRAPAPAGTAAFFGIVVAFVGPGSRPVPELIIGDLLALLGGAAWGLSNVVLRRGRVGGANTAKTVLYQVGVATLVLFAFASVTGQTRLVLSRFAIGSLLALAGISIVNSRLARKPL